MNDQEQQNKDFHARNLEVIFKLREKKLKEEEEKKQIMNKKLQMKENLKEKVLATVKQEREEKKRFSVQRTSESTPQQLQQLSEDKKQSNNLFRMRSIKNPTVINSSKRKEIQYDEEKQENYYSQTEQINKFNNPSSPSSQQDSNNFQDQKIENDKKEQNQKFFDRQRQYIEQISQKKLQEKQKKQLQEEKKQKVKEIVKEQVLSSLGQNTQYITSDDIIKQYQQPKGQTVHDSKSTFKTNDEKLEQVEEEDNSNSDDPNNEYSRKKPKQLKKYPFITDLNQWKKKQRLDDSIKVFIISGGYGDLKKALLKRGWVQNSDSTSPCFNLKFTLQARDLDYNNLLPFQIVNHFSKNSNITTKIGLLKSLRNLVWFNNVDINSFYPRGYDLSDDSDFEDFEQDFMLTKAESILKMYMMMYKQKDQKELEKMRKKTELALTICYRKIKDINQLIDDDSKNPLQVIKDKEWSVLSSGDLKQEDLIRKKYEAWIQKIEKQNRKQKKKKKKQNQEEEQDDLDQSIQDEEMDEFTFEVKKLLKIYKEKFPQYYLNGIENIWIVKPASLSRGRGIKCYQNLVEIKDHVDSKEAQWIVQKYIEKPIIIKRRKIDIRQWILVTDFNPLTIWFYEECYIRFTAEDYDSKDIENQQNLKIIDQVYLFRYSHLTNNSVAKKSDNFKEETIPGNMWSQEQFSDYLKEQNQGQDIFEEKIKPQMVQSVIWSLESVQDQVEHRKNSHELLGYDFMVDDQYKVWLIEVNSSPTMEYSTVDLPITERLVKEVLEDLAKVVVDFNLSAKKKNIDTGKFSCIHKGKQFSDKTNSVGVNFLLEGKQIKKP